MSTLSLLARIAVCLALSGATACLSERGGGPPAGADVQERLAQVAGAAWEVPPPTGVTREYELVAAPTSLSLLDGRTLAVWAYNGQVPGPILRADVGDRIRVRFTNRLSQPTSIHWHGMRLDNAMDGVPGVTQSPIEPGETFVYDFVTKDAGTFWFHPHLRGSEQVERGLHGILLVGEGGPPIVREEVWVLDDWRLGDDGQIDPEFVTRHDLAHDGRWGSMITVNGVTSTTLELRPGERARVRLLNVANGRVFRPRFGAMAARLVAFDGRPTVRPLPVDTLELAPGNRADVELVAPAQPQMIAVEDTFTRRRIPLASIRVDGAPAPADAALTFPTLAVPDWSEALALAPDETIRLQARRGGPHGVEWTLNDEVMRHVQHEHASMQHEPRYTMRAGRFTKLRFVNDSARLHPMHLHGQFFLVLARDGVAVAEDHWRDTVLVRSRETVDVALVPRDPGIWALHCHIQEHHDSGMMTMVRVE
ncbi:MAG: multicopper oxidase family protein [Myxococcales bacterium]|nr:multicopper oxidase family protein [Myxococcales bacterium]